jgi:FkbM family methyltransferase
VEEVVTHFSLVVVGAHDGSGLESLVHQAGAVGNVMLIEPVPFLFAKLKRRYAGSANVIIRNIAISTRDGQVDFIAPRETANSVARWGDQLGSLMPGHAAAHDIRMAQHVESIRAEALCFTTLLKTEGISSINILFTDTEGMDSELLPTFPFSVTVPGQIIFEFKHSDGPNRVGRKLAALLNLLEDRGYRLAVKDSENMIATHHSFPFDPSSNFSSSPAVGRRAVGRNDPCPCGSGLKYKRCCGAGQASPN